MPSPPFQDGLSLKHEIPRRPKYENNPTMSSIRTVVSQTAGNISLLSPCAIRALTSALDPGNWPAIDLADWGTVFTPDTQYGVVATLNPSAYTTEGWHTEILQNLESIGQNSPAERRIPDAMLLCVDGNQVTVRDLANAVAAMTQIAPKAAAILSSRGVWPRDHSMANDGAACLFATWLAGNLPESSRVP